MGKNRTCGRLWKSGPGVLTDFKGDRRWIRLGRDCRTSSVSCDTSTSLLSRLHVRRRTVKVNTCRPTTPNADTGVFSEREAKHPKKPFEGCNLCCACIISTQRVAPRYSGARILGRFVHSPHVGSEGQRQSADVAQCSELLPQHALGWVPRLEVGNTRRIGTSCGQDRSCFRANRHRESPSFKWSPSCEREPVIDRRSLEQQPGKESLRASLRGRMVLQLCHFEAFI